MCKILLIVFFLFPSKQCKILTPSLFHTYTISLYSTFLNARFKENVFIKVALHCEYCYVIIINNNNENIGILAIELKLKEAKY